MASPGFLTTVNTNKVSSSDCNNGRQPEMATWPQKLEIGTLPASLLWSNAVGSLLELIYVIVSEILVLSVSWLPSWIFDTR